MVERLCLPYGEELLFFIFEVIGSRAIDKVSYADMQTLDDLSPEFANAAVGCTLLSSVPPTPAYGICCFTGVW